MEVQKSKKTLMIFGFLAPRAEKNKSTADALYNVRRVITAGESTKTKTFLLLLDWAKAFDKITHKGLLNALQKFHVDQKLINIIMHIYVHNE